jgi:hypothetical protein
LKNRFLRTIIPTIYSQIKQEVVMNVLKEQRIKLHEKRLLQKAHEVSKILILRLSLTIDIQEAKKKAV